MARQVLNGVNLTNQSITAIGAQVTTNKLLGRASAGSGAIQEITLGTNLSFTGTTLNSSGSGSTSASDLTSGTLANARLTTRARASANLYMWSSFR
jgi:hypothetical protein